MFATLLKRPIAGIWRREYRMFGVFLTRNPFYWTERPLVVFTERIHPFFADNDRYMSNPWKEIQQFGQSLWYDNMSRGFVSGGELQKMIRDLGLRGITSNPSIFEKAIANGHEYDGDIESCIRNGLSTTEIYDRLTTDDIRVAADALRSVYDETDAVDGYVSIEVDPRLASDTEGSLEAARRLWQTIDRPNVMIKIPGTPDGIPAVKALLTEGINVNITLLFGLENYEQVAKAYIEALNERKANGLPINRIASVASFFLSRVDTSVDALLQKHIEHDGAAGSKLEELLGKAAVANAKLAYEKYLEIFHGPEFAELAVAGARPQRCLWASVSTKNPKYSDVMYIEPLIGRDTVTTVPDDTIAAFGDHGTAADTLAQGFPEAHAVIERLKSLGIDTEKVAEELQVDGVRKFEDAFAALAANLDKKRQVIQEAMA
jgi:transaldolase